MDAGIGPTLREARNRRKVDLSEVEAATKIRIRYLQAIENEEWDALPGGVYTRGFIRAYASFLGLDGDRLADDYRRATAPPGGEPAPKRIEPVQTGARKGRSWFSGRLLVAAVCLGLVALLIGIGLADGDGGGSSTLSPAANEESKRGGKRDQGTAPVAQSGISMRLVATAEVWVCLLDAGGEPLVDGRILEAGSEAGPFRSDRFEIALGNGSVAIFVDGRQADVPAGSSPVGYRVDSGGKPTALEEGERPGCE